MAVVIRMKRGGRIHAPFYRMVVMDSRNRNRGREIEQIGVYHPCVRPEPVVQINVKKALEWLYKGAQCSDTVRAILSDNGVFKAFAEGVKPEDIVETPPLEEAPVPPGGTGEAAEEAAPVEEGAAEAGEVDAEELAEEPQADAEAASKAQDE